MRRLVVGLMLGVVSGLLMFPGLGCTSARDPWEGETGSAKVVVTIAPLASFVRAVAGDTVALRCLCTTTGPHHYQLDTRDARLLVGADLLLAVGLRLDDSFADAMRSVARRGDLRYVKLGQRLPPDQLMELKHEHKHEPGSGHAHHHHGKWDPHVWLGIPEAIEMVGAIRDELCVVDAQNAAVYRKNAEAYVVSLRKLHQEGKAALANKKVKRIISFHEALGYLARSFGLEIAEVIEQGPGDEPSAGHLKDIVKLCQDRARPIAAITVEPQYPSSSSAAIIQRELKARGIKMPLVEIDPLETAELEELNKEGGNWYLTRMRKNLRALASTLP